MAGAGDRPFDWRPVWLTLRLAAAATGALLLLGTPLACWLSRSRARWRHVVAALVAMPLVLPPTVLGFYLLVLLSPSGPLGAAWSAATGGATGLVFSFTGLLIGSVIYSLPFVVQPLRSAFESLGRRPLEVAATLGAGPIDRFVRVVVPMAAPGFVTAATLGFAHTLGEFGVVLMIGGNVPGRTQVLSIALFDHVEALEYGRAHVLAAILLAVSFTTLWLVYTLHGRRAEVRP
ncbi:MAG: molybdate ABC transporter permease subunit [Planctomycetota bacterium]